MFKDYPYTDYHDLNLDYLMNLCRCSMGLHLEVVGDKLQLKNANDQIISDVTIHYADTALEDVDGNKIKSYIIQAGTDEAHLLLTHGDSNVDVITIPFATKAEKDVNEHDITSYIRGLGVTGNQILVTRGDGSTFQFTVPFANKAKADENGKNITTYVANLAIANDRLVVSDGVGNVLSELTITYAERADNDGDGDAINATYVTSLGVGTTTVKALNKRGDTLGEITVPYATMALEDTNGNRLLSDYAESLVVDGQRIGLEAHDGTRLSTVTVPFATLATDATNAVEAVSIVGDQMIFTTYGGREFSITAPYAVKAQKDDLGNIIKSTYIASVTNDTESGELTFLDATGAEIVTLIPTVNKATHDSYNNLIADYVKQIVVSSSSNYVTVTHGTGNTDSVIIHYAETAWKDTNDNVIKNTYIKRLACEEDVQDGKYKLVAYDGDTPEAELFRIALVCDMAAHDINGKDLTSYLAHIAVDGNDLISKDGENAEVDRLTVPFATNAINATFAEKDNNGKDLDSYVAGATLVGSDLNLYDGTAMPVGTPIDLSGLGEKVFVIDPSNDSNHMGFEYDIDVNGNFGSGAWAEYASTLASEIVAADPDWLIICISICGTYVTLTPASATASLWNYDALVNVKSVDSTNSAIVFASVRIRFSIDKITGRMVTVQGNPYGPYQVTVTGYSSVPMGSSSSVSQVSIELPVTQSDLSQLATGASINSTITDLKIDGISSGILASNLVDEIQRGLSKITVAIANRTFDVFTAFILNDNAYFVFMSTPDLGTAPALNMKIIQINIDINGALEFNASISLAAPRIQNQ